VLRSHEVPYRWQIRRLGNNRVKWHVYFETCHVFR